MRRWNLNALWLFCILQGFGGGTVPVAQSILFVPTGEARPSFCAVRRRRGAVGGGPTLGWLSSRVLSDQRAGWRGRDAMIALVLRGAKRQQSQQQDHGFDVIGFILVATLLGAAAARTRVGRSHGLRESRAT